MKYLVYKDKKLRAKYYKIEKKKLILRSTYNNLFFKIQWRQSVLGFKIKVMSIRIKSYCILTSRSRSIIKKFNISRICFKELASFGYLKGIKKSSW